VDNSRGYLGLASVPLPFPVAKQTTSRSWERVLPWKTSHTQQDSAQVPPPLTPPPSPPWLPSSTFASD